MKLFPHNVIRRNVRRKNKRARRKYNVPKKHVHDPKQPLIPFTTEDIPNPDSEGDDFTSENNKSADGSSSSDCSDSSDNDERTPCADEEYQTASNVCDDVVSQPYPATPIKESSGNSGADPLRLLVALVNSAPCKSRIRAPRVCGPIQWP